MAAYQRRIRRDAHELRRLLKTENHDLKPRSCRECGQKFTPQREWDWFCHATCDEQNHKKNAEWIK
jgi:uncharacterized OB-fold protein